MKGSCERTLERLRKEGVPADKVERWVPNGKEYGGFRRDWGHFVDIMALDGKPGILGIQAGWGKDHAAHIKKIREVARQPGNLVVPFLEAGNRLVVYSWRKLAGGRVKWHPKIHPLTLDAVAESGSGGMRPALSSSCSPAATCPTCGKAA